MKQRCSSSLYTNAHRPGQLRLWGTGSALRMQLRATHTARHAGPFPKTLCKQANLAQYSAKTRLGMTLHSDRFDSC